MRAKGLRQFLMDRHFDGVLYDAVGDGQQLTQIFYRSCASQAFNRSLFSVDFLMYCLAPAFKCFHHATIEATLSLSDVPQPLAPRMSIKR